MTKLSYGGWRLSSQIIQNYLPTGLVSKNLQGALTSRMNMLLWRLRDERMHNTKKEMVRAMEDTTRPAMMSAYIPRLK